MLSSLYISKVAAFNVVIYLLVMPGVALYTTISYIIFMASK